MKHFFIHRKFRKGLEEIFLIPTKNKVYLVLCIVVIAVSYISTPVIVRSMIDGLIPTKDESAIFVGFAILVVVELLSLIINNRFSDNINNLLYKTEKELSHKVLTSFFDKKCNYPSDKFKSLWKSGLHQINQHIVRKAWDFYRDITIILFLAIISLFIHYLAGIMIFVIFIVNFLMQLFLDSRGSHTKFEYFLTRQKEENTFDYLIEHREALIELGQLEKRSEYLKELLDEKLVVSNSSRKDHNLVFDSSRFVRTFSMLSIVMIGSYGYTAQGMSMGAIWAMLIVIFRLSGPLQRITQWVVSSKSIEKWYGTLEGLLFGAKVSSFAKGGNYNKNMKLLENLIETQRDIVIKIEKDMGEFYTDIKYWLRNNNLKRNIIFLHDRNWFLIKDLEYSVDDSFVLLLKTSSPVWEKLQKQFKDASLDTFRLYLYRESDGSPPGFFKDVNKTLVLDRNGQLKDS